MHSGEKKGAEKVTISLKKEGVVFSPKKHFDRKQDSDTRMWYYLGAVGEIGFAMAIPIVGGILLGKFLDAKLGTFPKGTLSFLFAGIGISMMYLVSVVRMVR